MSARVLGIAATLLVLCLLLPYTHWAARPLQPCDIFWQVRTGEITLQTGAVPDKDPFSYTVHGELWNNHEWGFEILAALLHRAAGWGGFRLLVLALILGISAGLFLVMRRRAGPAPALCLVVLFGLWSSYKMLPVPQTVSMAIFLAVFHNFRGLRLGASHRRMLALAAVMLCWGNLTAESVMFLPFFLADQLLLRKETPAPDAPPLMPLRRHAALAVLVCLAPLINPPWSSVLEYATVGTSVNQAVNSEFTPIWMAAATVKPLVKDLARAFMLLYLIWAPLALLGTATSERWRGVRQLLPGLLALVLAGLFERNLWLLLIPTARMMTWAAGWASTEARRLGIAAASLAAALLMFTGFALSLNWTPARAVAQLTSPGYMDNHLHHRRMALACLDPLASMKQIKRVYALRTWSSYIIWKAPHARVFCDGRNREYPLAIHQAGIHIWQAGPDTPRLLDATGTDAVVAHPGWGQAPHIRAAGWRPLKLTRECGLFLRSKPR